MQAPLVERERELEEFARLRAAARRGEGAAAIVEGPAGIGKTRLLAAAGEAAEDLEVLRARASELERDSPFGLERRTGARLPMLIGLAVMAVALVLLGFLVPDWTYPLVVGALLLFGIGLGLMSTPMSDAAVGQASGVPEPLAGMASGVFKMSSMLGSALGVALFATFAKLFATNTAVDEARAAGLSDQQITTLRDALVDSKLAQRILSSLSPDVRERVTDAAHQAFTSGVATTIKAAALVALVAAGLVMVLWPRRAGHAIGAGLEPVRQASERP
jgi:Major Facilitator Superfamily/AAA ATPase domain